MARPVAIVLLLVLFLVVPPLVIAVAGADVAIRTMRGPLPPSGLPPFAVTAITLLCIGTIVWYRRRKAVQAPTESEAQSVPASPADLLAQLLEETCRQQYHPVEIIERLMPILHSHLAAQCGTTAENRTSEELLAIMQFTSETGVLLQASELLRLCDSVRFGGIAPTFEQAERALQETVLLLQNHNEETS